MHLPSVDFFLDKKFFVILPSLHISRYDNSLGVEWLFFGIYLSFNKHKKLRPEREMSDTSINQLLTDIYSD